MKERRKEDAGPPTQLMAAWTGMTPRDKGRLQGGGVALLTFTVVVPMVGQVVLLALDRGMLPIVLWLFSAGFGAIGVAMIFPPLGVWAVSTLAPALVKLLPSGRLADLLKRPERRGGEQDES